MWNAKKLYFILSLLLVFSLFGEKPKLKEDLHHASVRIGRILQLEEVMAGWQSISNHASTFVNGITDQFSIQRAKASTKPEAQPINEASPIKTESSIAEKPNSAPKVNCGSKSKCPYSPSKTKRC